MKKAILLTLLAISVSAGAQEKTIQLGSGEPPPAAGTVDAGVSSNQRALAANVSTSLGSKSDIPMIGEGATNMPGATAGSAPGAVATPAAVPVPVYTTMRDAAAAGVNPLGPAKADSARGPGVTPLAIVDDSLWEKFQRQPLMVKLGALMALLVLLTLGVVGLLRQRND